MLISEVIKKLEIIQFQLGDVQVFMGSYYQDLPVEDIIVEDNYPLILNKEHMFPQYKNPNPTETLDSLEVFFAFECPNCNSPVDGPYNENVVCGECNCKFLVPHPSTINY